MNAGFFPKLSLLAATLFITSQAGAGSRLPGTGGVSSIEGSAGGGLSPWGMVATTASSEEAGVSIAYSLADTSDYRLDVTGLALGFDNRLELSLARQTLDLETLGGELEQEVLGAKVRLLGDPLYRLWGVWSLGVQHKRMTEGETLARAVGAESTSGRDLYLAGSKLFFGAAAGRNLLANLTLRATEANQGGLLGFGGDQNDGHELMVEGSLGVFLDPSLMVGVEYRQKPDNLGFAAEHDWRDLYAAWLINKHLSLTGALLDLGDIAGLEDQRGGYLSLSLSL